METIPLRPELPEQRPAIQQCLSHYPTLKDSALKVVKG